jgi:putative thioredoxin
LLGPILEKLADEYAGRFLLVKAEVDKLPGIAAQFNVQSIPAVYALRDGRLVDFFVGLLPENQIRAWIDRLLPSEAERLVAEGRSLEAADAAGGEARYREAARLDANLAAAKIALANLLVAQQRIDEARALLDELETRGYLEPEAEKVKAQLHVTSQSQSPAELQAMREAAEQNPADLKTRLALAVALAAASKYEEALQTALAIVETHDKQFVDSARQLMVDVFRLLPDDSELTTDYRRRLSTALY